MPDKGPYIDPEKARQIQAGALRSGLNDDWWGNLREGLGLPRVAASPAPVASASPPPAASGMSGVDADKAALAQESMRRAMPQQGAQDPGIFDYIRKFLGGGAYEEAPAAQGPSASKPDKRK
jgi:hypothetical protein